MIQELSRTYDCRFGKPSVHKVDTEIFLHMYCSSCMDHNQCMDICCRYGADIDITNVHRLEQFTDSLERFTGTSRTEWFIPGFRQDNDFPGGSYTRTQIKDGRCIFLNRKGRGCMIHSFCLENAMDFRILKPMVSSMFPVTFNEGLLLVPAEILDRTLYCIDGNSTLYRGARGDLEFFFGDGLIKELDAIEQDVRKSGSPGSGNSSCKSLSMN